MTLCVIDLRFLKKGAIMKFFITTVLIYISFVTGLVAEEIEFIGIDGITIYGDYHLGDSNAPLILLHHQAGLSARGEYGEITARLVDNGFNVLAVLSSSPAEDEFMGNCQPSEQAVNLTIPTMILRLASGLQSETNTAQFELFKESGHTMHVAENGVHGSSMLVADRTEHNADIEWTAVLSFLENVSN